MQNYFYFGHFLLFRLGTWEEWLTEGGSTPSPRRVGMSFTKGVTCWNGPARSTRVHLLCGAEDRLVSASEPGR